MSAVPRVRVLGMGNTLAGDDGIGPRVIEHLQSAYVFLPEIELVDVGTPGLSLTDHLLDIDVAILVDAVYHRTGRARVQVYRGDEAVACLPLERSSAHEPALRRTLAALRLAGTGPQELVLVGVAPERCDIGTDLSPPVRAAIATTARVVCRELTRCGVRARRRIGREQFAPASETI
ncbi:MAG: hydrogenase maturation protease [Vicinamibacterales bacterium]